MKRFWSLWLTMTLTFAATALVVTYLAAGYWNLRPEFWVTLALVPLLQAAAVWLWLRRSPS